MLIVPLSDIELQINILCWCIIIIHPFIHLIVFVVVVVVVIVIVIIIIIIIIINRFFESRTTFLLSMYPTPM